MLITIVSVNKYFRKKLTFSTDAHTVPDYRYPKMYRTVSTLCKIGFYILVFLSNAWITSKFIYIYGLRYPGCTYNCIFSFG